MYRTPYDIFEGIHGSYDPDKPHDPHDPHDPPFSVWMGQQKQKYLSVFPESVKNQIDGHFINAELEKFFRWISETNQQ